MGPGATAGTTAYAADDIRGGACMAESVACAFGVAAWRPRCQRLRLDIGFVSKALKQVRGNQPHPRDQQEHQDDLSECDIINAGEPKPVARSLKVPAPEMETPS
jgi:Zn-finger nucleic acid-binding protein